ncbi:MAG: adenylyl-sulfate kinase [Bacteroidetes bacterium]|nr:adenylyl-sulfate kinase [Bacteroidota bacterium]
MAEQKNIVPFRHKITKAVRQKANGHKSFVIWFTGLSGSGKSTLANRVEEELHQKGIKTYLLDGDNIRTGLNSDLGFSGRNRAENIRRIGEVAKLFVDAGIVVLTAFISPYRKERDFVRNLLGKGEFIEVYVKCPLEICEQRDTKGLYKKARKGEIKDFTGVNAPYEEPDKVEIMIDTDRESLNQCVNKICMFVNRYLKLQ